MFILIFIFYSGWNFIQDKILCLVLPFSISFFFSVQKYTDIREMNVSSDQLRSVQMCD